MEEAVRQTKAVVETAAAEAGGEVGALRDSLDAKTAQCEALHGQLQKLSKEHRELEEKMAETELAAISSKDARSVPLARTHAHRHRHRQPSTQTQTHHTHHTRAHTHKIKK